MRALNRKLLRDLWRLRGQVLATALVIGAGIALYVMSAGMLASLTATRDGWYAGARFVDISAQARRVPLPLLEQLRAIPGVALAEGRITTLARVEVAGFDEPVNAMLHSLPEAGAAQLNAVQLVRGRMPEGPGEILLSDGFARAHGLPGGGGEASTQGIALIVQGARMEMRVTGTAIAPDHVMTIGPGNLTSDDLRFAVGWAPRHALEGPTDQVGAFSELMIRLAPDARPQAVMRAVDRLLAPYGGTSALARHELSSDRFIRGELDQLAVMARILPPIFLSVAAFLLWVMTGRLIATEREQIGLMKAFGYRGREIALHYAGVAGLAAVAGLLTGSLAGLLMGRGISAIYARFFAFPGLQFQLEPEVFAIAALIAAAAAAAGAAGPLRAAMRLAPAAAMQPPAPPAFRGRAGRAGRSARLDAPGRMLLRRLLRWPERTFLGVTGLALATGLAVVASFSADAIDRMLDQSFNRASRQHVSVVFAEERGRDALAELAAIPGVRAVQPAHDAPALFVHGNRRWRDALVGIDPAADMVRLMDEDDRPVEVRPGGLVLSRALADKLGARPGSRVRIEVESGRRPVLDLEVRAIARTSYGTPAWLDIDTLDQVLGEGPRVTGAWLLIDPAQAGSIVRAIGERPMVAGVTLRTAVLGNLDAQMRENFGTFRLYSLAIAAVIVIGVAYNSGRLSFSEQVRDLATMRVLGYRTGEIGRVLIGEIIALSILALPFGLAFGMGLAWFVSHSFSTDMFTIPYAVSGRTLALAALTTLSAAIVTAMLVHRRAARIDLVRVLKSRD